MHTSRQPIRWGDMDMLGHVNNTVFFRYCEQARIEWTYGLHPEGEAYAGTGPVIVNASCTFLLPLVYPGEVEVRMYLGDPGRTSVGSFYEILKDGNWRLITIAVRQDPKRPKKWWEIVEPLPYIRIVGVKKWGV